MNDPKKTIPIAVLALLVGGLVVWLLLPPGDPEPSGVARGTAPEVAGPAPTPPAPQTAEPTAAGSEPPPPPAKEPAPTPSEPAEEGTGRMTAPPLGQLPSPEAVLRASNQPREEQTVTPRWFVGDAWTVAVYFREMQKPQGGWSTTPTRFRYRVTDETTFEGAACFEVTVDIPEQSDFRPEVFYVDRDRYTLIGLFKQSREQGKWVKRTHKFTPEEGPTSAKYTSVPFDLPGTAALGKVAAGDDAFSAFRFSEPGAPRPQAASLLGAGADYVEVSFSGGSGKVHQRWSVNDSRWPVESVSQKARSYRMN